ELQSKGYDLPDYPDEPATPEEQELQARYKKVTGSAVNPVLREGNSDRRAPASVKGYARRHPHSMGAWSPDSTTHVATMDAGDFRSNERSVTVDGAAEVKIQLVADDGSVTVLRPSISLQPGEILDATVMSRAALCAFLAHEIDDAKRQGVLFSLHLKATMMKVSDPILFGHAVKVFFADVFAKHGPVLEQVGANPNNGLASVLSALGKLPEAERAAVEADIKAAFETGPAVAMVDSDRGITNLHVPSDVIVDASMPAMIRDSGKMWNAAGERQDTKAVIPDHCYSGVYQAVIDFCRQHGAFDPTTMGSVPNVGLMAQAAEEYGSHDKTFEIAHGGTVQVVDGGGTVLLEHTVEAGDVWRACQTKDAPVRDWVKLAVGRARATGVPAVFWLDRTRAHDAELLKKIDRYLPEHDTDGLQIEVLPPAEAAQLSLERIAKGEDTISVTGNVLRDYLTDLFPILELGTSAKMLSIVPLMNGGGLFETGAGGSAPKHVQQFLKENHLRWDSLGEFLALAVSFELLATSTGNPGAQILADTLDQATGQLLDNGKSPSRRCGELDNRGSQFYLTMYWAQALAAQTADPALATRFAPLAGRLAADEAAIVDELNAVQGQPVDIGGYYSPDPVRASSAMRPSATFNAAIASLG
ncbi:MAG TPA: NADP-dependent isocitrate dehydrogenase, partial [Acidimicrobiia bacterium]|nr:NADP-dependent isocitrate dehydrogenase [Acidimicrobiia bacterium]